MLFHGVSKLQHAIGWMAGMLQSNHLPAQRDKLFTLNQAGGWTVELEMTYLLASLAVFFLGSGQYAVRRSVGRWD
jgi:hypothetical protein